MFRILLAVCVLGLVCQFTGAAEPTTRTTVVPTSSLKQLLPEKLVGLERQEVSTQQMDLGETAMSQALADYQTENLDETITVTYTDYGVNSELATAMTTWARMQMSRETEDELERTTKVQGFPAIEQYHKADKNGSLLIWVSDRLLVSVEANSMTMKRMEEAAEELPLKKFAGLTK